MFSEPGSIVSLLSWQRSVRKLDFLKMDHTIWLSLPFHTPCSLPPISIPQYQIYCQRHTKCHNEVVVKIWVSEMRIQDFFNSYWCASLQEETLPECHGIFSFSRRTNTVWPFEEITRLLSLSIVSSSHPSLPNRHEICFSFDFCHRSSYCYICIQRLQHLCSRPCRAWRPWCLWAWIPACTWSFWRRRVWVARSWGAQSTRPVSNSPSIFRQFQLQLLTAVSSLQPSHWESLPKLTQNTEQDSVPVQLSILQPVHTTFQPVISHTDLELQIQTLVAFSLLQILLLLNMDQVLDIDDRCMMNSTFEFQWFVVETVPIIVFINYIQSVSVSTYILPYARRRTLITDLIRVG